MKSVTIPIILFISLALASNVTAQSILDKYFNGNRDSMTVEAIKLINMPEPAYKPYQFIKSAGATQEETGYEKAFETTKHYFAVSDNLKIFAYRLPKKSPNTIVLLHGVKSNASMYIKTAGLLQLATAAEIYAIDLRGHGQSEGAAGDVEYINQYANDLADIIATLRKEKPNGKIIVAGHSMGGGVALRYAMAEHKEKIDGYLLFAPLIGHNSPAFPQEQASGSSATEPPLKIHIARIIGLKILNELNRHEHDSLPVLFFNVPESMPLRKYSYRANMSMAPENYVDGLRAVNSPLLVLIGSNDEAFVPGMLKKAFLENSNGEIHIIEGATHNDVRHHPQSFQLIAEWFSKL